MRVYNISRREGVDDLQLPPQGLCFMDFGSLPKHTEGPIGCAV